MDEIANETAKRDLFAWIQTDKIGDVETFKGGRRQGKKLIERNRPGTPRSYKHQCIYREIATTGTEDPPESIGGPRKNASIGC
jgi:hypothetical protein